MPNEMVKLAYKKFPVPFKRCYNACPSNGVFPVRWKCVKLVLLYKRQSKPRDLPSSYNPISLLDGVGKVFERMLLNRLEAHIDRVGALSDSQYEFRRSKSTMGAIEEVLTCVLISLDVKNAFNSAPWRFIDETLQRAAVPQNLVEVLRSYMEDRSLIVNADTNIRVTCGSGIRPRAHIVEYFL